MKWKQGKRQVIAIENSVGFNEKIAVFKFYALARVKPQT